MIQMNSLMEYLKRMDPQKRNVVVMLFIIILFHFLVIPLLIWNLGLCACWWVINELVQFLLHHS